MKCPKCQFENTTDSLFCSKCGTQLPSSEEIFSSPTKTFQTPIKDLKRGAVFANRYEFIEEIGRGGMARVYKVFDNKINEEVALKLLAPEISSDERTIERFRNEIKFARKIVHKNVGRMYDLHQEAGTFFITMEYVPGENLKSFIRRAGQLSAGKSISIAKQVCEGLAEAHSLGVVHRDLKPQNIMIDREGNARIMDFGIAHSLRAEGITGLGMMIGTPEYMSPEQVEGREVDQRADIYALGAILYEMVTGKLPFEGESRLSIALKHKTEIPRDPRELNPLIPKVLSQVILKCMEKEREKRYQTAELLLKELEKLEKGLTTTERSIIEKRPAIEKARRMNWKKILFYSSVALIIILLVINRPFLPRSPAIKSIAVLPFENVSADSDLEYLSDGITESIIDKLAQLPSLRKVTARSSVFKYKGKELDPQSAGRELGVDAVLVSRMSRYGDGLSIDVELMKVKDSSRIWGKQYRTKLPEIFAIQEEITNSITDNLRLRLTGKELERMRKRYTENTEAFVAYSRGRYFWNKRTEQDLKRAIEYFEQALHIDRNYALAYTGLSHSYLLLPEYGSLAPKEAYPKAKETAMKALEIDEMLADAHVSLAQLKRRYDYDWVAAEREYKRALELDPNNATAHHWYGYDLMCMTRFSEAIRQIRRALELDPYSLVINRNLGQVLYRAGRYDEAIEVLQRTMVMDPNFSYIHFHLGYIYLQKSMYDKALEEFQKERELARGWASRAEVWIGIVYAKMGQQEKAREILTDLIERSNQEYISQTMMAILYFSLGEDDKGFQRLEKAYEEFDTWLRLIRVEPLFDRVSKDPRFKALLKKSGLEH